MKIAIMSDIHGNDIALKSTLREVEKEGIKHLFILGDFVGYYYHPDEVLKLLTGWERTEIQGNHERMLKKAIDDSDFSATVIQKYGHGIEFAKKKLSKKQISELLCLPAYRDVEIDGVKFMLCHGSPWGPDYYVYSNSSDDVKEKCIRPGIDFVLLGHSHYQFKFTSSGCTVLGVGSIGQPRHGGEANWCTIDTDTREVILKSTPFNCDSLIQEVKENDPDCPYIREVLLRDRNE